MGGARAVVECRDYCALSGCNAAPDLGPGLVSLDDLRTSRSPLLDSQRLLSLDDLRTNDPATVGEKIPLEDIPQVFTNEFLD